MRTVPQGPTGTATTALPDPVAGLRPETIERLRTMVATTALADCPFTLTRAEARHILELAEMS